MGTWCCLTKAPYPITGADAKSRAAQFFDAGMLHMRKDFYVYFHKDQQGSIFYVGKGTKDRAWSKDRHLVWERYVSDRLNGQFNVEIHRDGLTEPEAEELEDELISEYGAQLINWINPGRNFDFSALEKYHQLRDANRKYISETKCLEKTDTDESVKRYRAALNAMREYESMTLERGLVAEMGVGPDWGDPNILNRLTICLVALGRVKEAIDEAERYFSEFPSALNLTMGRQIDARIQKLKLKEMKENTSSKYSRSLRSS